LARQKKNPGTGQTPAEMTIINGHVSGAKGLLHTGIRCKGKNVPFLSLRLVGRALHIVGTESQSTQ
jgi:hypothetical protein